MFPPSACASCGTRASFQTLALGRSWADHRSCRRMPPMPSMPSMPLASFRCLFFGFFCWGCGFCALSHAQVPPAFGSWGSRLATCDVAFEPLTAKISASQTRQGESLFLHQDSWNIGGRSLACRTYCVDGSLACFFTFLLVQGLLLGCVNHHP